MAIIPQAPVTQPIAGTGAPLDPRGIVPVNRTQPPVARPPAGLGSMPPVAIPAASLVPVDRPGAALPPNFRGQPADPSYEALQRAQMAQALGPRARAAAAVISQGAAEQRLNRQALMERLADRNQRPMPRTGLLGGGY